ncbi:MAG: adaptor protein MecA [Eubacteriales bacterium]
MKIEKVNDHQIRCTLTKTDLADRELKLSELAYGSEKAKSLFHDMMRQASYECGFEADDIPLMIEAIPMTSDTIVLIITKVEDPEELDTRFSKFSPSVHEEEYEQLLDKAHDLIDAEPEGSEDILDLYKRIDHSKVDAIEKMKNDLGTEAMPYNSASKKSRKLAKTSTPPEETPVTNMARVFTFHQLDDIVDVAGILHNVYHGSNVLYKNHDNRTYQVVLSKDDHTTEDFNKICNILLEYSLRDRVYTESKDYLEEHFEPLIGENALQTLATL